LVVDSEAVGVDWEHVRQRARLELEKSIGRELRPDELEQIRKVGEDTTRVEAEAKTIVEAYERLRRSPDRGAVELTAELAAVFDVYTEQIVGVAPAKVPGVRAWAELWEPNPGPNGTTARLLDHFDRPYFLGLGRPPDERWATPRELAMLLLVSGADRQIKGSGDCGADYAAAYAAAEGTAKKTRQRGHGRARWDRVRRVLLEKTEQVARETIARDALALEQVEHWTAVLVDHGDASSPEWDLVLDLLAIEAARLARSVMWHRDELARARDELAAMGRRRSRQERVGDTSTVLVSSVAPSRQKAASVHDLDAEADDHGSGPPLAGGGGRSSHRSRVAGR